ncbi:MAG: MutH/Sau3AI family endonuclease [Actinomycetota bacterium]
MEHFFGIPRNSRSEADFPGAGIELKVVPLVRSGNKLRVKERTVISMIDYGALAQETWATASVRKKLRVLFVFFEHIPDFPKTAFPIRTVVLWEPDAATESFIRADWERVWTKVRHGDAHLLSESDGRIMGPCTKGADSTALKRQPFNPEPAKSRAFALKPAFTLDLYERTVRRRLEESLVANHVTSPTAEFEARLLERFEHFEGRTVDDVAAELGVPPSNAKSYAAMVMRRAFGAKSFRAKIREFEQMGLTPRMTRVGPNLMPYEALSFPAFRYSELLEETWEDSDLLSRIEYMLIVPVHGESKSAARQLPLSGTLCSWRPTASELDTIRREWEVFRLDPTGPRRPPHARIPNGRDPVRPPCERFYGHRRRSLCGPARQEELLGERPVPCRLLKVAATPPTRPTTEPRRTSSRTDEGVSDRGSEPVPASPSWTPHPGADRYGPVRTGAESSPHLALGTPHHASGYVHARGASDGGGQLAGHGYWGKANGAS